MPFLTGTAPTVYRMVTGRSSGLARLAPSECGFAEDQRPIDQDWPGLPVLGNSSGSSGHRAVPIAHVSVDSAPLTDMLAGKQIADITRMLETASEIGPPHIPQSEIFFKEYDRRVRLNG